MDFPLSVDRVAADGTVKHIVSWSGGKDSSAMLIRMVETGMHIDDIVFIEVMATPTLGAELPEMYEYMERMERYIGRKITVVRSEHSINPIVRGQEPGQSTAFLLRSAHGAMTG